MFTGIIQEVGQLAKKTSRGNSGVSFSITSRKLKPKKGQSIAVNGVCLTVTKKTKNGFEADVVAETLKRTNIGTLDAGSPVNLEPSMRLTDAVDGHFILGHIDTVCRVLQRGKIQHGTGLKLELPKELAPYILKKGSVALNGVSLTVASVTKNSFTVALIPFTQLHTNLDMLKSGDLVNIEIDILARYAVAHENRHRRLTIQ